MMLLLHKNLTTVWKTWVLWQNQEIDKSISVKSVCKIVKAQVLAPETAIKSATDAIHQQSKKNRTHTKNHFKLKKDNKDQIFCNFICEM